MPEKASITVTLNTVIAINVHKQPVGSQHRFTHWAHFEIVLNSVYIVLNIGQNMQTKYYANMQVKRQKANPASNRITTEVR